MKMILVSIKGEVDLGVGVLIEMVGKSHTLWEKNTSKINPHELWKEILEKP